MMSNFPPFACAGFVGEVGANGRNVVGMKAGWKKQAAPASSRRKIMETKKWCF